MDTDLVPSPCPWCGTKLDGAMSLREEATPSPGDLSVCATCGGFLQFDDHLQHRKLENLEEIPSKVLWKMLAARRLIILAHKKSPPS